MEANTIHANLNFTPRPYQVPLTDAIFRQDFKRLVTVWHRRSGKDKTWLAITAAKMFQEPGNYFYLYPTYTQGKKALWRAIDRSGFRMIRHIPKPFITSFNSQEMFIEIQFPGPDGEPLTSTFQIIGTSDIDAVVGTNPRGVVFSEYSLQDPAAWDFLRPILAENGGWAGFNFTPRGENHAHDLYELAKDDPENWYSDLLTVDDTHVLTPEILEQEKREIIRLHGDDALYYQEYYCDFSVPIMGAYYANQMKQLEKDGQLTRVAHDPKLLVDTWWDLGIDDSMSIIFTQQLYNEIRVIDYYENSGEGLAHYIKVLSEKKYNYGKHHAPHDIEVRELTTGKSRKETARSLGIDFVTIPRMSVQDGIEAVRNLLPRCYFDREKAGRLISALKSYHKDFDEKGKVFRTSPDHDWSSHGADAFRGLAVGFKDKGPASVRKKEVKKKRVVNPLVGY